MLRVSGCGHLGQFEEQIATIVDDQGADLPDALVDGVEGQQVTIVATSDEVDTYLIVIDAEANIVAENDDTSKKNSDASVEFTVPSTGVFLVGVLAAMASKTGKVGFVGGMDIPLIRKFALGYEEGAKYVNPQIEVTKKAPATADICEDLFWEYSVTNSGRTGMMMPKPITMAVMTSAASVRRRVRFTIMRAPRAGVPMHACPSRNSPHSSIRPVHVRSLRAARSP